MNLVSKSIIAALTGTILLGSAAFGEDAKATDVKATKVSPIKSLLPDSFGKVDMRQYTWYRMTDDEVKGVTPKVQVRATLGSSFLNNKLSSSLILAGTKGAENTAIANRRPELYNEVEAYSGTYGSINPYLDLYLPSDGNGTDGTLSFASTAQIPTIELAAGKLDLSTGIDPYASMGSRATKTTKVDVYTDRKATFLTANSDGETEVVQKEPSVGAEVNATIGFKPAAVAGLGLSIASYVSRDFDPKYEVTTEGENSVQNKTGYATTTLTKHRVAVSYKLTDAVSLSNETWHKMNGVYAARYDGGIVGSLSRVTNIVKLTYTLF